MRKTFADCCLFAAHYFFFSVYLVITRMQIKEEAYEDKDGDFK